MQNSGQWNSGGNGLGCKTEFVSKVIVFLSDFKFFLLIKHFKISSALMYLIQESLTHTVK